MKKILKKYGKTKMKYYYCNEMKHYSGYGIVINKWKFPFIGIIKLKDGIFRA